MTRKILALTLCIIIFTAICFTGHEVFAYSANIPELDSGCAVLIDASTGQVLYGRNMHEKAYPASTTKIMTCILALEKGGLENSFTADEVTVDIEPDSSSIKLSPGETLTVEQLLYGLMLRSGNDAANALAQYVSGSLEDFADLMNWKAAELGAKNTHFANAHGYHDDQHYTTAYDMAAIMKYAITIPEFVKIISTVEYQLPPTEQHQEPRYWKNTHKLLAENIYEPVVGGKTGWTTPAGYTLATYAKKNGRELIAVIMKGKSRDAVYNDTIRLLEYGFNSFKEFHVPKDILADVTVDVYRDSKKIGSLELGCGRDYYFLIPVDVNEEDIIREFDLPDGVEMDKEPEAWMRLIFPAAESYWQMDSNIGSIRLVPGKLKLVESQEENGQDDNIDLPAAPADKVKLTPFQIICFTAGGGLLILFAVTSTVRAVKRARKRREMRARDNLRKKARGWL